MSATSIGLSEHDMISDFQSLHWDENSRLLEWRTGAAVVRVNVIVPRDFHKVIGSNSIFSMCVRTDSLFGVSLQPEPHFEGLGSGMSLVMYVLEM
jgi:hypothetical protein